MCNNLIETKFIDYKCFEMRSTLVAPSVIWPLVRIFWSVPSATTCFVMWGLKRTTMSLIETNKKETSYGKFESVY